MAEAVPKIPVNDLIQQQEQLAPKESLDAKDLEISSLLEKISQLQAPKKITPQMSLRDDGFDNQNIDLLQMANASYLREINKYNAIFD